jgi:hypothetical protein
MSICNMVKGSILFVLVTVLHMALSTAVNGAPGSGHCGLGERFSSGILGL